MTDTSERLDIAANRSAQNYSKTQLLMRVAWGMGKLMFRASPRPCFGFRRWLLRRFGAQIGRDVHIYPTADIYFPWNLTIDDESSIGEAARVYNLGPCRIGKRVTISQHSHLCGGSHDYHDPAMTLIKSPITIEDEAWVCADAFVGPGVTVGAGAIVAARAVVIGDVGASEIVGGNPAKVIKRREASGEIREARM